MINEELKQFIKDSLARGIPVATIKTQLVEAGWAEADVNEAIALVSPKPASAQPLATTGIPIGSPHAASPSISSPVTSHVSPHATSPVAHSHIAPVSSADEPEKNSKRTWILLGTVIILAIIFVIVLVVKNKAKESPITTSAESTGSAPIVDKNHILFSAESFSFSYPKNWNLKEYANPRVVSLRSGNDFLDESTLAQPVDHSPTAYGTIAVFYTDIFGFTQDQIAPSPEVLIGREKIVVRKYETTLSEEGSGDEISGSARILYFLDNGIVIQYASQKSTEDEIKVLNNFLESFSLSNI